MENLIKFVQNHLDDDSTRLILDRNKWPDIDMNLAVNCIESRRKLKDKVRRWHDQTAMYFPSKLSAEQCSSDLTGAYKADVAVKISGGVPFRLADLTGGLGVDTWYFSEKAEKVLYNEMQTPLYEAAIHNFKVLGCSNISFSNLMIDRSSIVSVLSEFKPDIVYMDPARRGEGGRKVFLIEECTPDILTLRDEIFAFCRNILVKLSPMADISMVCGRLGHTCREVHVVGAGGECKELLIWMDREWNSGHSVTAIELHQGGATETVTFTPQDEKAAEADICREVKEGMILFEPGKALMKSGAFNTISMRTGMKKLGLSTHYYICESCDPHTSLGKYYRIDRYELLNKQSIKAMGLTYPKAEVTARNISMDTDTLRKRLGVTSGGDTHIFGLRSDCFGQILLACTRL